jgi:signal transduction histidine kinase
VPASFETPARILYGVVKASYPPGGSLVKESTDRQSPSLPLTSAASLPAAPPSRPLARGTAAPTYHKANLRPLAATSPSDAALEFSSGVKQLDFPTNEQLYLRALDAAIELLHADGGVLATLEPAGQRMIVRCQRESGLVAAQYSALASLGQTTQRARPPGKTVDESSALELQQTQPLQLRRHASGALAVPESASAEAASGASSAPGTSEPPPLAADPPASPGGVPEGAHAAPGGYTKGRGLLGYIWQMNQALALSSEKCKDLPRDAATPVDQEAPWYIAAPIRAPQVLIPLSADAPPSVVGVIALSIQDSHWSATKRHTELLQLHADRIALALQAAWLEETREQQARFLHLLHDASLHFSTTLDRDQLFEELHQLASASLAATSFAVLLTHQEKQEVEFGYIAGKGGQPRQVCFKEAEMPDWWAASKTGKLVYLASAEQQLEQSVLFPKGWQPAHKVESLLVVPMLTQASEESLGALVVTSDTPRVYRREQVEMMSTIARTAAFALENADLHHRSARSQEQAIARKIQVAALNNAVLTLNSSLQLEETLANLITQFKLLTVAQVCSVFLLDEDEKTLVVRASNADIRSLGVSNLEEIRFVPSRGLMKKLKTGEQIFLDHLDVERQSQTPAGELYRRFDIHSVLLFPIRRHETLLGMLCVYTPGQRYLFSPEEISLLGGLASQAAVAIHNARLFTDLQKALEQQKELDRLKDEFIVTASHEFRTPLSAIHGYASLLQRHSAKLTAEQAQRFSTEITRAAQQLVGMVQTLMDASRLDSGKLTLSLQPVEVRPLAESALALTQPDIQQPIHVEIASGLWVYADQERLRQVMTNLLTNAGKYSPASSPIDFVARVERVFTPPHTATPGKAARPTNQGERVPSHPLAAAPAAAPGTPPASQAAPAGGSGYLIVSVADRGEGISVEDQKHLFQKFVRLQKSLTTPVRGTGLGLYICRQYLTAMGGFIWVESTPGQGSTFRFALPLVAPPAEGYAGGARMGHSSRG